MKATGFALTESTSAPPPYSYKLTKGNCMSFYFDEQGRIQKNNDTRYILGVIVLIIIITIFIGA